MLKSHTKWNYNLFILSLSYKCIKYLFQILLRISWTLCFGIYKRKITETRLTLQRCTTPHCTLEATTLNSDGDFKSHCACFYMRHSKLDGNNKRNTQPGPLWGMENAGKQRVSLKITRGQSNKRWGLEARMGKTEKERESKKKKIQEGGIRERS